MLERERESKSQGIWLDSRCVDGQAALFRHSQLGWPNRDYSLTAGCRPMRTPPEQGSAGPVVTGRFQHVRENISEHWEVLESQHAL